MFIYKGKLKTHFFLQIFTNISVCLYKIFYSVIDDLSKIYCELLACEKSNSSNSGMCLPIYVQTQQRFLIVWIRRLVKTMPMSFLHKMKNYFLFCRIYNIIRHLRQTVVASVLMGISAQTLTDTEIHFLEKGLDFALIQSKINQPEQRKDFKEFSRRMGIRWNFHSYISETSVKSLCLSK